MSIKDIITVPDQTLKKISEPLEKVSTNEKKLINDLSLEVEVLQSDGSTLQRMIMPPSTNNQTLIFTATQSDGSSTTKELDMGE